jgi:hypothetical protein
MLTPPAALPPGDLVTPDAERLFYHVSYSHHNYPVQTDVVARFGLLNACAMIRCKKNLIAAVGREKKAVGILIMICNCERT